LGRQEVIVTILTAALLRIALKVKAVKSAL